MLQTPLDSEVQHYLLCRPSLPRAQLFRVVPGRGDSTENRIQEWSVTNKAILNTKAEASKKDDVGGEHQAQKASAGE